MKRCETAITPPNYSLAFATSNLKPKKLDHSKPWVICQETSCEVLQEVKGVDPVRFGILNLFTVLCQSHFLPAVQQSLCLCRVLHLMVKMLRYVPFVIPSCEFNCSTMSISGWNSMTSLPSSSLESGQSKFQTTVLQSGPVYNHNQAVSIWLYFWSKPGLEALVQHYGKQEVCEFFSSFLWTNKLCTWVRSNVCLGTIGSCFDLN